MVASLSDYSLVLSDPCHSATQSAVSSTSTRCASIFRFHFRRFSLPLWGAPVCAGFRCLFFRTSSRSLGLFVRIPSTGCAEKKRIRKEKIVRRTTVASGELAPPHFFETLQHYSIGMFNRLGLFMWLTRFSNYLEIGPGVAAVADC